TFTGFKFQTAVLFVPQVRQSEFAVHIVSPCAKVPWVHTPELVLHVPAPVQKALRRLVSNCRKTPPEQTVRLLALRRISTLTGAPTAAVCVAGFTKTSTPCARAGPARQSCRTTKSPRANCHVH